jgi:hypothetical protein
MRGIAALMIAGLLFLSLAVGCGKESSPSGGATGSDTASSAAVQSEKDSSAKDPLTKDSLRGSGADGEPTGQQPLTATQKKRLGSSVRRLLTGDTLSLASNLRKTEPAGEREGENVYSALVEGASVETLQEAGVPVISVAGGVITTRLTTDEIRRVASIQEVRRIRFPKRARSQ